MNGFFFFFRSKYKQKGREMNGFYLIKEDTPYLCKSDTTKPWLVEAKFKRKRPESQEVMEQSYCQSIPTEIVNLVCRCEHRRRDHRQRELVI